MIFHNVESVYVPLLYLYFLKDISPEKLNNIAWGAAALARIQGGLKSAKTFKGASWLLECFILGRIPRVRNNYIGAAYRLDPFPSLSAPTLIGWSKMLERPSKNRYIDEDYWKQILSNVTGERIFFTTSVLFDDQLISYHMLESAPRQLGIERAFTVPKRYRKKLKAKDPNYPPPPPHPLVDPNYPFGASNDGSNTPHDGPHVQDDGPNAPSEDASLDDHPNDIADPSGTGLNDTLDFDGPDVQNNKPYAPLGDAPLNDHPNIIADPSCTGVNDTFDFDLPHNSNNDLGTSSAGSYDNSDSSAPALRRSKRQRHPVTRWSPISVITL
ncbi:hypothetical protein Salat_0681100 [Sesamum alatum]|uniref:Uncharacterized protein n=1 Tax=Sesamum alatum TaxID=300844 RepID=A0AAE1YT37_9LAMI|nr:hypothetical protein Salat_0681100 [Sesamum alatum]